MLFEFFAMMRVRGSSFNRDFMMMPIETDAAFVILFGDLQKHAVLGMVVMFQNEHILVIDLFDIVTSSEYSAPNRT